MRDRDRDRETETERERPTDRQTETERQRDRQRQRQRHRDRQSVLWNLSRVWIYVKRLSMKKGSGTRADTEGIRGRENISSLT